MRLFTAIFGLFVAFASPAPAQLASPGTDAGASADVSAAATPTEPQPADATRGSDPYASLQHCRQEVRSYLAVSSQSRSRRLKALEDCIAAAESRAHVEVVAVP